MSDTWIDEYTAYAGDGQPVAADPRRALLREGYAPQWASASLAGSW
jgi:hypothetical protein